MRYESQAMAGVDPTQSHLVGVFGSCQELHQASELQ